MVLARRQTKKAKIAFLNLRKKQRFTADVPASRDYAGSRRMKNTFHSIASIITDIRRGRMVIVVDDADRENEGDLIPCLLYTSPSPRDA